MKLFSFAMALSAPAFCVMMLSGCSDADWNHAMTYSGLGPQRVAADTGGVLPGENTTPPAPQTSAAPDTSFCQSVAKQDATSDGLDAATQQRVFQRSFQQCVEMFGPDQPQAKGTMASRAEPSAVPENGIR